MIFSLFDIKAEVFGPLFEARTCEEAKRLFISVLLNNGDSNVTRYPQDHNLYCLGDFDNLVGVIEATAPNMILTGFEACQMCNKYREDVNSLFAIKEEENDNSINTSNYTDDTDSNL